MDSFFAEVSPVPVLLTVVLFGEDLHLLLYPLSFLITPGPHVLILHHFKFILLGVLYLNLLYS